MAARDDLDHDAPVFDPLDGLVAGVNRQLLADRLFDRDLATISYSTAHNMNCASRSHSSQSTAEAISSSVLATRSTCSAVMSGQIGSEMERS